MEIKRPEPHTKLPENAKLALKGEIFDVYQWEQILYDGSTAIFERLTRNDTVSVVPILPDGRILLIKQIQPGTREYISCVAGRMEEGEDPLSSMQRELLEETGYKAEKWQLWDAYQPVHKMDWAWYIFLAKCLTKVQEPHLDGGEKIEALPVTLDEFLRLVGEHDLLGAKPLVQVIDARVNEQKKEELKKLFGI